MQKKKRKLLTDLQDNSLKSRVHDSAVCLRIPHILRFLLSMTHGDTGSLTITFLKSASFRRKGKGVEGQPWHPPHPLRVVLKHDAHEQGELTKWQPALLQPNVRGKPRGAVCRVAGIRLQNEGLLTNLVDNRRLGLWSGPLRAIWSLHGEPTNGERRI